MKRLNSIRVYSVLAIGALVLCCNSNRAVAAGAPFASSLKDGGQLVIKRSPRLGNVLIVDLQIDGKSVGGISYGRTYRAFLQPGHHVLSVMATPRTVNPDRWEMGLDVSAGQTYTFTAQSGGARQLVLAKG
jgi:hypothetical protein